MNPAAPRALDRDNPWPGLAPFDEGDRAFFHGRQTETADLLRLVRREPLTVLFGRSGLGKSSLLKAGLFPALRDEDLLPVYLRLDHAEAAPPLVDQLLQELRSACQLGRVQASPPAPHEGLWSYFHRRDAEFWSALNRPVTPVIVFDQFEEIFTLGQDGDAARARSAAFLRELADLVENRPPAVVKLALEHDPAAAGAYEFRRATVKLVLSFREDFLAEMEGLKPAMPSVMVNRLRLLPMDGTQAFAVVTEGGGALVGDEVARRILRLAWKNEPAPAVEPEEFPRIEIDPALLSVVCSELNHKRLGATPPLAMITPALLAGADREILAGFYERGVAGLDGRVRAFVEDELITDRGFRDSHDWDDALALPGVSREALAALIARRLLRVDERQGQRRLELTHDVLTRVVMDSRDRRRAREAEEAAQARERLAAEQQRKNRRKGALLMAGVVLALLLAGVAGWQALDARKLLQAARSSRLMAAADRARTKGAVPRLYGAKVKLKSLLSDTQPAQSAPSPVYGEHNVIIQYRVCDLLSRSSGRLVRFVAVTHPCRGSCLLMCTDLCLGTIEIIRLYGLRFKIEHSFKQAVNLIGTFTYHFWMQDMKPLRRGNGNQYLHRESLDYRNAIKRKVHAYHVFIQAGVICQGLLQYLAVAFPTLVWNSFGSWLRTIRPGIPPSELVVANALRQSLPEFLLNTVKTNFLAKFIVERQDPDTFEMFRLAT